MEEGPRQIMAQDNDNAVETTGKTVDTAVQSALKDLGLKRAQVRVAVLQEGRTGIFGIGTAYARVRVTPLSAGEHPEDTVSSPEAAPLPKIDDYSHYQEVPRRGAGRGDRLDARPQGPRSSDRGDRGRRGGRGEGRDRDDRRGSGGNRTPHPDMKPFELLANPEFEPEGTPTEHATNVLLDLLRLMGLEAKVSARDPETAMDGAGRATAVLDIHPHSADDGLGVLIGPRGETLAALQYLLNLIVNQGLEGRHSFTVDVDGYRKRREESLIAMTTRAADRVRETHEMVTLEPMSAAERRIVHIVLAEDPELETESTGNGDARRVQIVYCGHA